ncbi:MAG: peptidylprolyl isomerase [Polyangiaceae bacterium]
MIQGGDPTGTGKGEGGYVFADEVWPGANHDRRGLICMANRGKNTNSMQFFILDGSAPHLNGGYTIFGECGPDSVIEKLASTPVQGDRAVTPPKIKKVNIKRVK